MSNTFKVNNPGCACDCGPCSETICAFAWFQPDPPGGARTPIEAAAVTVERVYTDPVTHLDVLEDYTTCATDAEGKCCVPTPDPFPDPTVAPTVDPVGGGTSGGTLPVGAYTAAYSRVTHYGETRLSPASAEFQVGIPDGTAYPALSPPTLHDTQPASGGLLAVGTYYAIVVYTDGAGHTNLGTATDGFAFDVTTLGDVPRITVPSLSLRPNAADFSVYLSPDSDEGPFRLYLSGQTTTAIVPLAVAYNPAGAVRPTSNTSVKGIPRVTYTPGVGTVTDHVWATAIGFTFHRWKAATTSPVDLGGTFTDQALPTTNTTAHGRFKVTCDPPLCAPQSRTVTVGAACVNVGFDFLGKRLQFNIGNDCCYPPHAQIEIFLDGESIGISPAGTVADIRLFGLGFDVSDLLPGTVLDWTFTDTEYPSVSGTVTVPECGGHSDVTITRHLTDLYTTLSLTLPSGETIVLTSTDGGPFVGGEIRAGVTYTWHFNDPSVLGNCNAGGLPDAGCGLAVSYRCFDCSSPVADDIASAYVGICSRQIRSDGYGGTLVAFTQSCFPLLYTWTDGTSTWTLTS